MYVRVTMARWGARVETAEQKQTHGSGRILKPGPCSIKASLGPSSLEAPPLLCCRHTHVLWMYSLPLPPFCFLVVCWAASSLSCLPLCHSAAPPCLPRSTTVLPPLSISSLHRYDCSGVVMCATAEGRGARACPCVCPSPLSSPIHGWSVSLSLIMWFHLRIL